MEYDKGQEGQPSCLSGHKAAVTGGNKAKAESWRDTAGKRKTAARNPLAQTRARKGGKSRQGLWMPEVGNWLVSQREGGRESAARGRTPESPGTEGQAETAAQDAGDADTKPTCNNQSSPKNIQLGWTMPCIQRAGFYWRIIHYFWKTLWITQDSSGQESSQANLKTLR